MKTKNHTLQCFRPSAFALAHCVTDASWLGRAQSMPRIVQAVARRWPGLAALGKVASSQQL
ncbi:hypothetical protein [Massilia agri]